MTGTAPLLAIDDLRIGFGANRADTTATVRGVDLTV